MLMNLKILRQEKHISQKALADAIGVSQQSINKYENHNIEPDIDTLIRMADYFNTSVDYLIGYSNIRHKIEAVQSYELNKKEGKILEQYRKLSLRQKQSIELIIDLYIGNDSESTEEKRIRAIE